MWNTLKRYHHVSHENSSSSSTPVECAPSPFSCGALAYLSWSIAFSKLLASAAAEIFLFVRNGPHQMEMLRCRGTGGKSWHLPVPGSLGQFRGTNSETDSFGGGLKIISGHRKYHNRPKWTKSVFGQIVSKKYPSVPQDSVPLLPTFPPPPTEKTLFALLFIMRQLLPRIFRHVACFS